MRVGPATPITYEFVPAREGMVANGWPLGASTWDNDWDSPIEDWCPRTPSAVEGPAARCGSDCSWSGESLWEGSGDEEEEVDRVRAYEVQPCCSFADDVATCAICVFMPMSWFVYGVTPHPMPLYYL